LAHKLFEIIFSMAIEVNHEEICEFFG
jgi:hypothetical protein